MKDFLCHWENACLILFLITACLYIANLALNSKLVLFFILVLCGESLLFVFSFEALPSLQEIDRLPHYDLIYMFAQIVTWAKVVGVGIVEGFIAVSSLVAWAEIKKSRCLYSICDIMLSANYSHERSKRK